MGWINLLHNNTQWPARSKTVKKFGVLKKGGETVRETKERLGLTSGGVVDYVELVKIWMAETE